MSFAKTGLEMLLMVGFLLMVVMVVIFGGRCQVEAANDLVYQVPEMAGVSYERDITYKETEYRDLKMDIYYPPDRDSRQARTVILIHGIGPASSYKDTAAYRSWGKLLAVRGFNAVTFNWRAGSSPADVADLISFVHHNQDRLAVDGDRLCAFAFSAGVKGSIPEVLRVNEEFARPVIEKIAVYYGELADSILETDLKQGLPPIFIAMAASDYIIPPGCNDDFVARAREMGYQVTYLTHQTGRHGFEIFNNNQETRQIIDRTISFLQSGSEQYAQDG